MLAWKETTYGKKFHKLDDSSLKELREKTSKGTGICINKNRRTWKDVQAEKQPPGFKKKGLMRFQLACKCDMVEAVVQRTVVFSVYLFPGQCIAALGSGLNWEHTANWSEYCSCTLHLLHSK